MGALQLAIFMLIITYFRAVDTLAQSPNKLSERLSGRQELALQGNTAPPLAQLSTKADGSPYLDAQNENNPLAFPLSLVDTTTSQTDMIVSDNPALCSPVNNPITGGRLKRRGGKQRRGATKNPESTCPSSAITTPTDTDTRPSRPDEQQQPQTEENGREQGHGAHDGSPKPEELNWPNLFKIPGIIRPVLRLRMGWCRSAYARIQHYNLSGLNGTFSCKSTLISSPEHGCYPILNSVRFHSSSFFFRKSRLINCSPHTHTAHKASLK